MLKLNAKLDADLLLYSLSHFEGNHHTVHMLTQWHLLPPLNSTVKLSLFTHVHSSPLSLAAKLHQCHANHSCYINNGWTFSRQTSYRRRNLAVLNEKQCHLQFKSLIEQDMYNESFPLEGWCLCWKIPWWGNSCSVQKWHDLRLAKQLRRDSGTMSVKVGVIRGSSASVQTLSDPMPLRVCPAKVNTMKNHWNSAWPFWVRKIVLNGLYFPPKFCLISKKCRR